MVGDGIMALFGVSSAHEDHAVRACHAALARQTSVQRHAAAVEQTRGVPIYGWSAEGFNTADLQKAQALLTELS
jgi:hypothetical protein